MAKPRKIVDARNDKDGNISHVLLEGNQNFTPVSKAVSMADQGKVENAHAVHPKVGDPYLRSDPDGNTKNNLDEMAKS